MEGILTNSTKNIVNEIIYRGGTQTFTGLYLAVYTTGISADGSGTEVSFSNGYSRLAITASTFSNSGNSRSNTAEINFPEATGTWGTITHFGILDASTGGNVIMSFKIPDSQQRLVVSGDIIDIPTGELTFSLSGDFTNYTRERVNDRLLNQATKTTAGFASPLYIGLFSTSIGADGSGTEFSGYNYARKMIAMSSSGVTRTNVSQIIFNAFSVGVTGFDLVSIGIIDASTGGNIIASATTNNKSFNFQGAQPRIDIGTVNMTII